MVRAKIQVEDIGEVVFDLEVDHADRHPDYYPTTEFFVDAGSENNKQFVAEMVYAVLRSARLELPVNKWPEGITPVNSSEAATNYAIEKYVVKQLGGTLL